MKLITSQSELQSFNACQSGLKRFSNSTNNTLCEVDSCEHLHNLEISDVLWLLRKKNRKDIIIDFAKKIAASVFHLKAINAAADAADAAAAADAAYAAAAYAADAADAAAAAAAAAAAYAAYAADAAYAAAAAARKISKAFAKCLLVQLIESAE